MTGRILHVFPYDPRHLGQTFTSWAAGQLARWPLAAVARSRLAPQSSVHVIGPRARRMNLRGLEVVEHRALASGPRYRDWGDDWSFALERTLRGLGAADVAVIHLNDYAAARFAHRAAAQARVVLVFHGRGVGSWDEHAAGADLLVVLREDAATELRDRGAGPARIAVVSPSVDRELFHPAAAPPAGPPVLGFVGRLEASKGVLDVPHVLRVLADRGIPATVELVGAADAGQRAAVERAAEVAGVRDRLVLLGERAPEDVAARMRAWRALLFPSYTEGQPLTVLEACASEIPVAAVADVLPHELADRPGVATARRGDYADLVYRLVVGGAGSADAGWVLGHDAAAEQWDALIERLPEKPAQARVPVSRSSRVRRFRPARRAARAVLRRR